MWDFRIDAQPFGCKMNHSKSPRWLENGDNGGHWRKRLRKVQTIVTFKRRPVNTYFLLTMLSYDFLVCLLQLSRNGRRKKFWFSLLSLFHLFFKNVRYTHNRCLKWQYQNGKDTNDNQKRNMQKMCNEGFQYGHILMWGSIEFWLGWNCLKFILYLISTSAGNHLN